MIFEYVWVTSKTCKFHMSMERSGASGRSWSGRERVLESFWSVWGASGGGLGLSGGVPARDRALFWAVLGILGQTRGVLVASSAGLGRTLHRSASWGIFGGPDGPSWGSIFGSPDGEVPAVSVRFVEAKRSIFGTALGASLEASCTQKRWNLENHTKTNRK